MITKASWKRTLINVHYFTEHHLKPIIFHQQNCSLQKHCVNILFSEKPFLFSGWLFHTFNDLIMRHWLREKTKFYIWNELHSIVTVRCKYFSILRRSPTGGMKKNIILFVREAWTSYLRMNTNWVGEHFEISVWRKFPLIF